MLILHYILLRSEMFFASCYGVMWTFGTVAWVFCRKRYIEWSVGFFFNFFFNKTVCTYFYASNDQSFQVLFYKLSVSFSTICWNLTDISTS